VGVNDLTVSAVTALGFGDLMFDVLVEAGHADSRTAASRTRTTAQDETLAKSGCWGEVGEDDDHDHDNQ
jgi:hypothetical protein